MKVLYTLLNWYTQRYAFPTKGWKFIQPLLHRARLAGKIYKKRLVNGLFLYVNATDHIQKTIFWYGYYENEVSRLWYTLLHKDSIVIDIGANIGYFSLLAAAKASSGKVIAFEPVPLFRERFQQNMAVNAIRNTELHPCGISNKQGKTTLFLADSSNLGMSGLQPPENDSGKTILVETITLDAWLLLHPLPRINFIKVDIEGAEKNALEGMENTLQKHQPVLLLEIIQSRLAQFGSTAEAIYTMLFRHRYQAYSIINAYTIQKIYSFQEGYDILFLPAGYIIPASITIMAD